MENDTEVIRQQMADTRQALSEKVEAVESLVASAVKETTQAVTQTVANVTNTVENVTHAVEDTVSNTAAALSNTVESTVNTVSDSVQSVKEALDVTACVEKYPWFAMAGSVALGYTIGYLFGPSEREPAKQGWAGPAFPAASAATQASSATQTAPAEEKPSAFASLLSSDAWKPVIDRLQGLAVGTAAGLASELIMDVIPESMKQEVSRMLDDTTKALGGTILRHEQHSGNGHAR